MKDVYDLAFKEIGTYEWAEGSNPKVVQYYADSGNAGIKDDSVAWCAAFVGAMLKRAGYKGTGSLAARSYLKWGESIAERDIQIGDVIVLARGNSTWQGHVFFAAGKPRNGFIDGLGGNQQDAVNIQRHRLTKFLGARRGTPVRGAKMIVSTPHVAQSPQSSKQVAPSKSGGFWASLGKLIADFFVGYGRNKRK